MIIVFLWLLLLCNGTFVGAISPSTSWVTSYNGTLYLYSRGILRKLPSTHVNETIKSLFAASISVPVLLQIVNHTFHTNTRFQYPERIQYLSDSDIVSRGLRFGSDIPVVYSKESNLDERLAINTARIFALQDESLIISISDVGAYINPAIVRFQDHWLMLTCSSWSFPGLNDNHRSANTLYFRWVYDFDLLKPASIPSYIDGLHKLQHNLPSSSSEPFLGLSTVSSYIQNVPMEGQDPRVLMITEDVLLSVFTVERHVKRFPGMVFIVRNISSNELEFQGHIGRISFGDSEKNWIPFHIPSSTKLNNKKTDVLEYLEDIYLIQNINPLTVVQTNANGQASTVSSAPYGFSSYRYGTFRGGTNAIDLGDRFLAIFHSSTILPFNAVKTYFMGAFTFTKTSPFRLLSVSSEPILVPWWYEGPWNPFSRNRKIDYCIFPVSLSFVTEQQPQDKKEKEREGSTSKPTVVSQRRVKRHLSSSNSNNSNNNRHLQTKGQAMHPHRYSHRHRFSHHNNSNQHSSPSTFPRDPSIYNNATDSDQTDGLVDSFNEFLEEGEEEGDDVQLMLTLGIQDKGGLSMILSLKTLLLSMEPVVYCDDRVLARHHPDLYHYYC